MFFAVGCGGGGRVYRLTGQPCVLLLYVWYGAVEYGVDGGSLGMPVAVSFRVGVFEGYFCVVGRECGAIFVDKLQLLRQQQKTAPPISMPYSHAHHPSSPPPAPAHPAVFEIARRGRHGGEHSCHRLLPRRSPRGRRPAGAEFPQTRERVRHAGVLASTQPYAPLRGSFSATAVCRDTCESTESVP